MALKQLLLFSLYISVVTVWAVLSPRNMKKNEVTDDKNHWKGSFGSYFLFSFSTEQQVKRPVRYLVNNSLDQSRNYKNYPTVLAISNEQLFLPREEPYSFLRRVIIFISLQQMLVSIFKRIPKDNLFAFNFLTSVSRIDALPRPWRECFLLIP